MAKKENKKKTQKQKVIWFNLPYSNKVKTNIGKKLLKLVRRHFQKGHTLNKIFNKNTSSIFLAENEKQYECNCKNKDERPLEKTCLTTRVIYEADVITLNTSRKFYIRYLFYI